jgi:spore coat protein A, manganese oxidase
MITRRQFLKTSAIAGAGLMVPWRDVMLGGALPRAYAQAVQTPLPGSAIPQFVDPLPLLSVAGGPMETIIANGSEITLMMREFRANVMPSTFVPASGTYRGTWVWGYRAAITPTDPAGTYIGPVIVATRSQPTQIRFVNDLTAEHIAWRDWSDQTLHWADPERQGHSMEHYGGSIPAVAHLHGGEVPSVLDGGPDAWFTRDGEYNGHAYYDGPGGGGNVSVYRYPNTQEAAPIWFHDHVLGATRLNVYAGLAGAYPIIDADLTLPTGLHPIGLQQGTSGAVDFVIPMVIQDRMFDTNGQLFFPTVGINPEHPFWVPEFEGDTIVVNGKVWPFLNVAPKRYRFLFINGSNARAYEMFLTNPVTKVNGPPLWQIATDGGYLDGPVKIDPNARKGQLQRLVIQPGERADVIIDFAGFQGQTLVLRNIARHPFDKGIAPNGNMLGRIIQFRVNQPFTGPDLSYDPAAGTLLRPPMVRLVTPATGTLAAGVTADKTRQLTLNEVMGPGGPLEILVNNTKYSGASTRTYGDFTAITIGNNTSLYSELPQEGETEVWEIVNLTADVHPIHTHLTQFQLMNRQNFGVAKYNAAYNAAFPGGAYLPSFGPPLDYNTGNGRALGGNPDITPFLKSKPRPPAPNEAGWKDTIQAYPGQVTRIVVRFAPTDKPINDPNLSYPFNPDGGHGYVWHCHIVDHEDNEMMRPYTVQPKTNVERSYIQGIDY